MERVLVLLSTYNGERYLREQLASLFSQELPEGTELRILVRDDGSSDGTTAILREYEKEGRLSFYSGERNLGPAGSFLSLMKRAEHYDWGEERAKARTYYALCDQDDVWLPDKLSRALFLLFGTGKEEAVLYYGLPRLVDAELRPLPLRRDAKERMLDFASALIKSNSTGCTMLFTRALLLKINRSEPDTEKITMHDEWIHKGCLAIGGRLIFDEDTPILYRQHGNNAVGCQSSGGAVLKRYLHSLLHPDRIHSEMAGELLRAFSRDMSPLKRELSEEVAFYRRSPGAALRLFFDRRIRTAYRKRNFLFRLAVLLRIF